MSTNRPSALLLLLLSGCAGTRGTATVEARKPAPLPTGTGMVFCADGAGGFGGTTVALQEAVAAERSGQRVEMVDWSHGRGRMMLDHLDWRNIEEQGQSLASQVRACRSRAPHIPVYLVGHSAGCAVVLVAAEVAPPGSIERVVLLAPSVSADYDLRPALAGSRQGIDVFFSRQDWFVLGLGLGFSGTTDRRWAAAAGRVGFRPIITNPGDRALYARLHQHGWEPSQGWTGHEGGHYGSFNDAYLRAYVLPLLRPAQPPSRATAARRSGA